MGRNSICVIYDSDENYAKRLMSVINDDNDIPYNAQVFTQGRRTRAVIVMDSGNVVLSSLLPDTIAGRLNSMTETEARHEA